MNEAASAGRARVPARALAISLAALGVPVITTLRFPGAAEEVELLTWILAIIPIFLLSYYRGWRGAAVALAVAMALLAIGQAILAAAGLQTLAPIQLMLVVGFVSVAAAGVGAVAELLHLQRSAAFHLAMTDVLTGLENRRAMEIYLERQFAGAARQDRNVAVVIFDLDNFKGFNDRFGHAGGDEVLREFGAILRRKTRAMDLSARIGGEEFVSVLSGTPDGAAIFAQRVADDLAGRRFHGQVVTLSAGVAGYDPAQDSAADLLEAADRALYRAKAEGRNTVRIAGRDAAPGRASTAAAVPGTPATSSSE
jgi:diguanylate cyclase (GGDEF)-like protein